MRRSAVISDCGHYRYRLEREWGDAAPMIFIMLNPSTADADVDDPTIRRCISFARRDGCGGIVVINLFALRATNPDKLRKSAIDPVGPDNGITVEGIFDVVLRTRKIICAWGAHALAAPEGQKIVQRARSCNRQLWCLGKTQLAQAPRHPLYVNGNQSFEAFP